MSEPVGKRLKMSENSENEVFEDENDMFEDENDMFDSISDMSEPVGKRLSMSDNVGDCLSMSDNVGDCLSMSDNVGDKKFENAERGRSKRVGEDERIRTANGLKTFDEFRSWIKLSYTRRNKEGSSDALELRREELEAHIRKNVVGDNLKRFIRQNKEIVGANVYNLFYKNEFVRLPDMEPSEGAARSYEWNVEK